MILNALLYFANKGSLKTFFFLHARVIFNAKHQRQQKEKKNCLEIMLSAYARTSQAKILHLDQNAAKCTTFKWLYGKFQLLIAHQLPKNHSSSSKWLKFFGEAWKGTGGGGGSFEGVSLTLIYIYLMNSFICTVFNLWITRSIRNKLLWTLRYANVSLRCRHLS